MSITSNKDICYSKKPPIYKNTNQFSNIKTHVFAGNDREKNLICIKIYEPTSTDTQIPEIYQYEPKLLEFLQDKHPAFPRFFGGFTEKGRLYIVVEYIEHTLESIIKTWKSSSSRLQGIEILTRMKTLVEGMMKLKSFGVYHNCINPSNILISSRKIKIIDFSNVRLNTEPGPIEHTEVFNLSSYLPPEVLSQPGPLYRYDPEKSDVFALGLCFLEICSLQDIAGLNQPENLERLESLIESLEESTIKQVIKAMLDPNEELRPTWQQLQEFFYIKKVKYPLGSIQSSEDLKLTNQICEYNNGSIDFLGMIGEEKVVVRNYNTSDPVQLDFSDYYVSSLSALSGKLNCFLTLMGAFEEQGKLWVVYENYGQSIEQIIKNRTVFSIKYQESELIYYFKQLLVGLEYCFAHKIYHNNINPGTVFIISKDAIKFNSFGPPYYSSGNTGFRTVSSRRYSSEEPFNYYPPEIYQGDLESGTAYEKPKADIYALGLVLYEMATFKKILLPNSAEVAQTIFNYTKDLEIPWIKDLLQGMLKPLPNERLGINELISIIPSQQFSV